MNINQEIADRNLPPLLVSADGSVITGQEEWEVRRKELLELIAQECYGQAPDMEWQTEAKVLVENDQMFDGKAIYRRVVLNITCSQPADPAKFATVNATSGSCQDFLSIPINLTIPKQEAKAPSFIWPAFDPLYASGGFPMEEIIGKGYAVASFFYEDMALDRPNRFASGLPENTWGAIARWAWASSRILDYLQTVPELDPDRIVISGASRLGKAALWAGITDERYSMVAPMIDGTGGCSLYRQNALESIEHVIREFPHWFSDNFKKYEGRVEELPYDAHFLVALCAPRRLYLSLSAEDIYADYKSEFLAAAEASKVYQLYGLNGLIADERWPAVNDVFAEGEIGMHLKPGPHAVTAQDWELLIEYREKYGV